jgi:hypothetical protein
MISMHKTYSSLIGFKDMFFVGKGVPCLLCNNDNVEETDLFEQKNNYYFCSYGTGECPLINGDGYFFEETFCCIE